MKIFKYAFQFVMLIATAGLFVTLVFADSPLTFEHPPEGKLYDYKITRVLDGDTVEVEAPYLPMELREGGLKLRILGIDTPEKGFRAKCPKENMLSLKAKYFVEEEVGKAKETKIWIKEWDKYGGRVLGDVSLDGQWLSEKMIAAKFAVEYHGEKKDHDWCKK